MAVINIAGLKDKKIMIFGGIDIGGTSVKVGFVDNNGKILCSDLFHVEKIKDYKNFLKTLHNSII